MFIQMHSIFQEGSVSASGTGRIRLESPRPAMLSSLEWLCVRHYIFLTSFLVVNDKETQIRLIQTMKCLGVHFEKGM